MCNFCNTLIYIKTIRHTKPLLAPLTEVQALRDKLIDMTGETYLELPNGFCPMCGKEIMRSKQKERPQ